MLRVVHVRGARVRYCLNRTFLKERESWRIPVGPDRAQLDATDRRKESQSGPKRGVAPRRVARGPETKTSGLAAGPGRNHKFTENKM